jgi:transposase-like protein
MTIDHLKMIGKRLVTANRLRDEVIAAAKKSAIEAVAEGYSEVEVARALGVDRSRTLRRWLGK